MDRATGKKLGIEWDKPSQTYYCDFLERTWIRFSFEQLTVSEFLIMIYEAGKRVGRSEVQDEIKKALDIEP